MNTTIKIGHLTADPVQKAFGDNRTVVEFRIGVRRNYKDKDGNRQSDFFSCKAYGQKGDFIYKYGKKGSKVCITGSDENREGKDSEGRKTTYHDIIVDTVELLDSREE